MSPQGLATFPGIAQIHAARVTMRPGVSPGVIRLRIAPQATLPSEIGPLTLSFGDVRIRLAECRVNAASLERAGTGRVVALELVDRRWKWRYGHISGSYNVPQADGTLLRPSSATAEQAGMEQSPRQLAARLLTALGERDFDVSGLPEDARPRIAWRHLPPAEALADLCERFGCQVTLTLDGHVAIRPPGVASALPSGPLMEQTGAVVPPDYPDEIIVQGGASRYQADLQLEAVGLDADGAIRPIDALTYRPPYGWSRVDLPWMMAVADPQHRALARRSLFRWYRVRVPQPAPGFGLLERLDQFTPLGTTLLETIEHEQPPRAQSALLFGVWCDEQDAELRNVASSLSPVAGLSDPSIVCRPWRLDAGRALVKLSAPLFAIDQEASPGAPRIAPAELRLRTSYQIRDQHTGQPAAYQRRRSGESPRLGAGPLAIIRPELTLRHIPQYDASYGVQSLQTNRPQLDQQADRALDTAWRRYRPAIRDGARYAGLLAIDLDGAVQSVTWQIDPQGATTRVALHHEPEEPSINPSADRRRAEQVRALWRQATAGQVATPADASVPLEVL